MLILLPFSVVVLVDYVEGPGKEDHDFRLMYNFNTKDVSLSGSHIDYTSRNGVDFTVDFTSSASFSSRLLCGSEDPKGGWISYGYPVREPIGQVTFAYGGKAPFMAATIIKAKGDDSSVTLSGDKVEVVSRGRKWIIGKEGVEEQ